MTDISLDLFNAYFAARQNKRNTFNQLKFEYGFESNLLALNDEINNRKYKPLPEMVFMVHKPVKREIFAADFRDRVVHHLLFGYLNPIMEKYFINDCYSCRKGKGTSYGINRVNGFIKSCSLNYKKDCYILKLDIQGYFMSINKIKLFELINQLLNKEKAKNNTFKFDEEIANYLLKTIIFNEPTKNCRIKGNSEDWKDLPKTKSLFYSSENCGLPIGNLTSQLFGNIYMTIFDHFVKRDLGIRYYGRYVDDFILVHNDKEYLKSLIQHIQNFLLSTLKLTLHPKKIYLQHYSKGVQFLGAVIKPNRIYIANRTKSNFYMAIEKQNSIVKERKPTKEEELEFISSMNSYLGIMKQYNSYKLRKGMLIKKLSGWWWNYVYLSDGVGKFVLKEKANIKPVHSVPKLTGQPVVSQPALSIAEWSHQLISTLAFFVLNLTFITLQSFNCFAQDITITFNLRGSFESKITLLPLSGANALKPIAEKSGIKNGETAIISVSKAQLPAE